MKAHFISPVDHLHTVSVIMTAGQFTAGGVTIDIHRDVFLQSLYKLFPTTVGITVGDEPSCECAVGIPSLLHS